MNTLIYRSFLILALFTLSSCFPSSVETAIKKGAEALNAEDIFNLVNDNTIRLISSDFDADIFLADGGKLSAMGLFYGTRDTGFWDIKSDGKLCIKFSTWYYGDEKCYSIYRKSSDSEDYTLFTDNGATAYGMTVAAGNINKLKIKSQKAKDAVYVRSSMEQQKKPTSYSPPTPARPAPVIVSGPAATDEEIQQTVRTMALDCPGCNLAKADLRQADLVGANLKGANLSGADLSRANLRRANLEGANLSDAILLSANLPGANLRDADLTAADFSGSNLIHADFTGADLDKTILTNTLREGAKGL